MTFDELIKSIFGESATDEQIQKLNEQLKANKMFFAGEENLDIRYKKLKEQHDEATTTIETLKKNNSNNSDLQTKITEYETKIADLQKEAEDSKREAAMDRELLKAGAKQDDLEYLKFKWREKTDKIEVDEKGNIKSADDTVSALKTSCSLQFESTSKKKDKKITEQPLPTGEEFDDLEPKTLAEALKMADSNNE